ncbi:MAG: hypothetical protein ACAI35_15045 [Candidatus Methylacidiphilales bacterium]|nr:hypothetical protein [Candidatus Methylacidiphilales bacterium]
MFVNLMSDKAISNISGRLRFSARAFRVPGPDYSEDTTQDAFGTTHQAPFRYVVADGSGQTFMPRVWARYLVTQYLAAGTPVAVTSESSGPVARITADDWAEWLSKPQIAWEQAVEQMRRDLNARKSPLAWAYNNNFSERKPAAATLAGIEFVPQKNGSVRWAASIVGDTCLFLLRGGKLTWYPLLASTDFDRFTPALRSYPELNFAKLPEVDVFSGTAEPGDIFFIATDALAKWAVTSWEGDQKQKGSSWRKLLSVRDPEAFTAFVLAQREDKTERLDPDDTTLLMIDVEAAEKGKAASTGRLAALAAGVTPWPAPVVANDNAGAESMRTLVLPPAPPSRPQRLPDEVKVLDEDEDARRESRPRPNTRLSQLIEKTKIPAEPAPEPSGYVSIAYGATIVALCAIIALLATLLWWKSQQLSELQKAVQPGSRAPQSEIRQL